MRKALIHIGSSKTGSTAIQHSLAHANAEESGFGCLQTRGIPPHLVLAALYRDFDALDPYIKTRFGSAAAVEAARPAVHAEIGRLLEHCPNLVLSSEFLFSTPPERIRQLKADLFGHGIGDFRIVCYVREPAAHYLSDLQEFLKNNTDLRRFLPQSYRYRFRETLQHWQAEFPGQLAVRAFERAAFPQGNVIHDFHGQIDGFFGTAQPAGPEFTRNESLCNLALFAMHHIQRQVPALDRSTAGYQRRKLLRETLETGARRMTERPARSALHPSVARYVNQAHAEDLRWLATEYGIRFAAAEDGTDAATVTLSDPPHLSELVVPPNPHAIIQLLSRLVAGQNFGDSVSGAG